MVNHGIDRIWDERYKQDYHCTDLFIHPLMLRDVGDPAISSELVDDADLLNSRIYKEWASPQGFRDTLMAMLGRSQAQLAFLGLTRRHEQPRYAAADSDRLRLVVPHVQRALRISDILDHQSFERSMFVDIVDAVNVAVFVIDDDGRLRHRNAVATQLLKEGTAVRLSGPFLCTAEGVRVSMTSAGLPKGLGSHDVVTLPLPLRPGEAARRFALFFKPAEAVGPLAPEVWGRKFGLTGSELRVLVGLVEGQTPGELAARYGLSAATIKTHILNMFRKTGTRRQPELVRAALLALPPALSQEGQSRPS